MLILEKGRAFALPLQGHVIEGPLALSQLLLKLQNLLVFHIALSFQFLDILPIELLRYERRISLHFPLPDLVPKLLNFVLSVGALPLEEL